MSLTIDQLTAWLNRIQNRLAQLATSDQVEQLLASVEAYKTGTETRLNTIDGRLDSQDTKIANHEQRLQDLEA